MIDRGHKSMALLWSETDVTSVRDRLAGHRRALHDRGLPELPERSALRSFAHLDAAARQRRLRALLGSGEPLTALLFGNAPTLALAVSDLLAMDVDFPGSVELASMDQSIPGCRLPAVGGLRPAADPGDGQAGGAAGARAHRGIDGAGPARGAARRGAGGGPGPQQAGRQRNVTRGHVTRRPASVARRASVGARAARGARAPRTRSPAAGARTPATRACRCGCAAGSCPASIASRSPAPSPIRPRTCSIGRVQGRHRRVDGGERVHLVGDVRGGVRGGQLAGRHPRAGRLRGVDPVDPEDPPVVAVEVVRHEVPAPAGRDQPVRLDVPPAPVPSAADVPQSHPLAVGDRRGQRGQVGGVDGGRRRRPGRTRSRRRARRPGGAAGTAAPAPASRARGRTASSMPATACPAAVRSPTAIATASSSSSSSGGIAVPATSR